MAIWPDQRVVVPSHVVTRHLDDELVLLNLDSETYFGLDPVGTRMWELLAGAPNVQAAYDQLMSEYEVDEATLRDDVAKLVGQLSDSGLIELRPV